MYTTLDGKMLVPVCTSMIKLCVCVCICARMYVCVCVCVCMCVHVCVHACTGVGVLAFEHVMADTPLIIGNTFNLTLALTFHDNVILHIYILNQSDQSADRHGGLVVKASAS